MPIYLLCLSLVCIFLVNLYFYIKKRSNPNIGDIRPKGCNSWLFVFFLYIVAYFSFITLSFLSVGFLHHVWDVSTEGSYLYWKDSVENYKVYPLLAKFHRILDYCPTVYLLSFEGDLAVKLIKFKQGYEQMEAVLSYWFRRSIHVFLPNMYVEWLEECPYGYESAKLFCKTEPFLRTSPLLSLQDYFEAWQNTILVCSDPEDLTFVTEYCNSQILPKLFFPEIPEGGFPGGVSVLEYYQGLASGVVTYEDLKWFLKSTP